MSSRIVETALSRNDAAALARLHRRAFPDFFLSKLGESFLVQFYRGFAEDPTAVIVLIRNELGTPIGISVGTTRPQQFFRRLLIKRWPGFAVAGIYSVLRSPKVLPRLFSALRYRGDPPPDFDGALLSSICVDPAVRGEGLGRMLLHAWSMRAREKGARSAYLTTDKEENELANCMYRTNGWNLTDEFITRQGRRMNVYVRMLDRLERPSDGD